MASSLGCNTGSISAYTSGTIGGNEAGATQGFGRYTHHSDCLGVVVGFVPVVIAYTISWLADVKTCLSGHAGERTGIEAVESKKISGVIRLSACLFGDFQCKPTAG